MHTGSARGSQVPELGAGETPFLRPCLKETSWTAHVLALGGRDGAASADYRVAEALGWLVPHSCHVPQLLQLLWRGFGKSPPCLASGGLTGWMGRGSIHK